MRKKKEVCITYYAISLVEIKMIFFGENMCYSEKCLISDKIKNS